MATIFAPMQSRKPGICVVRANPVPMIPIPTGDLFMGYYLRHRSHGLQILTVTSGKTGDHDYELAGTDGFRDVHLVACRECLASIDVARVGGQSCRGCVAAFIRRKRAHLPDKTVAVFLGHRDVTEDYVRLPLRELRECFMRRLAGFYFSTSARDHSADDLPCFRFVVDEQHSETIKRMTIGRADLGYISHRRFQSICQERKCRDESRAFVHSVALRGNGAAVKLHEVAHDGEAESQSAKASRRGTISLAKSIKYARQKLRIDSLARVFHRHTHVRSVLIDAQINFSSIRSELHRIRQQVPDDLV